MNYANITDDVSHFVRDASLELAEDRHLQIMEDPGQRWVPRGHLPRDNEEFIVEMLDLC